jgi:phenylacetate-CoA ligase
LSIIEQLVRHVSYPLWDLKDRSHRLAEYRALLRSQWLPSHALAVLQLRRLNAQLTHCWNSVPFYQRRWERPLQLSTLEQLQTLPLVTKRDMHESQRQLISNDYPPHMLVEAKTGGSTGTSLRVLFDRRCQERRNAAAMRSDAWAGWRPGMLIGALWGTPPVPSTVKEKLRNALHDRIFFLDTMDLSETTMTRFVESLTVRRAGALFGHSHSLYVFAKFIGDQELPPPHLSAVISTSMMLLENERALIERVFGCPVTNRYGCEEVGLIASECERHSGLHLNAEHVLVEILRSDGSWAASGEEGAVVVTDLVNYGMPLVRYRVEDFAVASDRACPCGRGAPLLERIVGRVADFLVRRDGSRVAGVSLVEKTLTAIPGIEQLQIVQNDYNRFELNLVAEIQARSKAEGEVVRVLRDVFGDDTQARFNYVGTLPQDRNSKYRFAICKVSACKATS